MSLLLPTDVTNIILDYLSDLRNMGWIPFIDNKTEKLIWKVNKRSSKYKNINEMLKYRISNKLLCIDFIIRILRENQTLEVITLNGYRIKIADKKVNKYINIKYFYIQITNNDLSIYNLYLKNVYRGNVLHHELYFDIYQDNNIFGTVNYMFNVPDSENIYIEIYKY
jgi:hypothetical protein